MKAEDIFYTNVLNNPKDFTVKELKTYTNQKVLEALEKEVPKAFKVGSTEHYICRCYGEAVMDNNEYYKTEVELKYK